MPESFWNGGPNQSEIEQDIRRSERAADVREGRATSTREEDRDRRVHESTSRSTWGDGRP